MNFKTCLYQLKSLLLIVSINHYRVIDRIYRSRMFWYASPKVKFAHSLILSLLQRVWFQVRIKSSTIIRIGILRLHVSFKTGDFEYALSCLLRFIVILPAVAVERVRPVGPAVRVLIPGGGGGNEPQFRAGDELFCRHTFSHCPLNAVVSGSLAWPLCFSKPRMIVTWGG